MEEQNNRILFIENNHQLANSWKKFLELLFPVDVDPAISVAEAAENIRNQKYGIIFIHLPQPEKISVAVADEIRALEKQHNLPPVPLYIFVFSRLPEKYKVIVAEHTTKLLCNENMLIDAGNCIINDLNIQPKMKDFIKTLEKKQKQ